MPCRVSAPAYRKIVAHTLRHPYGEVNGVLLGRVDGKITVVEDALAVSHIHTTLKMTMEAALAIAVEHSNRTGQKIVGYYHCNAKITDTSFGELAKSIGNTIHANNGLKSSVCLLVNSNKINHEDGEPCLEGRLRDADSKGWVNCEVEVDAWQQTLSATQSLIKSREYTQVSDFDDFLDDPSKDWFNSRLGGVTA